MDPTPSYLKALSSALAKGDATEHTHRPALKAYLEALAPGLTATNEPRRIACGAPDYILTKGEVPLGYIEAKDIGESLDKVEKSDQMARYKGSLGNLILTDYLEFRWYAQGEKRLTARLGTTGAKGKITTDEAGTTAVLQLLQAFQKSQAPTLKSPKDLASRMASLAQMIHDIIKLAFKSEDGGGTLHAQLKGFQDVLLHDLNPDQFADMYAQTIAYGLFAARCANPGDKPFTRMKAPYLLPKTNPFLRTLFGHIAGYDLDDRIAWAVDDLAELLNRADIAAILKDFGRRTRQEDPVVHFYETFLAAYDPKLRQARGVYYTPEPVVSYIVRSVDHLLKTRFGLKEGLADASKVTVPAPDGGTQQVHKVQVLDPATGTGTFLHGVIDQIHDTFQGNEGLWSGYVSEHLLPRLFGFELLMAPYAVAHLKLGLQLAETGYDFHSDERLRIYLTNTLEEAFDDPHGQAYFSQWLAEEAQAAGKVKREAPVMVVLGNPPYSGHSANKGDWIKDLLKTYKEGCPELKKPGQAKWLNDDYVKFIRFAQWRIEQTGHGVLAFISNHGYLDNPTFRGMRQSLMKTFDEIHILDLHGNSKKKETSPDGSPDKNVFDIQQGVAIGIFVRRAENKGSTKVLHADLYGSRDAKYELLNKASVPQVDWVPLEPTDPYFLFVPRDSEIANEYDLGWKVSEIFSLSGDPAPGIVTTHDEFAISWSKDEAIEKVERLLATKSESEARSLFRLCSQDQWQYSRAKKELPHQPWKDEVTGILYRPFDMRWTVYNRNVAVHRRERVMGHMQAGRNIGLISARSNKSHTPDHFFCSRLISEAKTGESTTQSSHFPLYLYPDAAEGLLIVDGHRPNLNIKFVENVSSRLKLTFIPDGKGDLKSTFGPEDVFAYAYAIFHAPGYRSRYAEFLKIDFPRLPLTSNLALFRQLCGLGEALVGLHLMEHEGATPARFPIKGTNEVEKVRFEPGTEDGRVWINATQHFAGVPEEVWDFHVGGYQVCEKWLKDRKGRVLGHDDLQHYCRVVAALGDTIRLMGEVDEAIQAADGWPLK